MKRALPIVAFLVLTLFAVGAGVGVNRGILVAVALPEGAEVTDVKPGAVAAAERPAVDTRPKVRTRTKQDYLKPILDRYLFDSTKAGQGAVVEGGGDEAPTDLGIRLIGTIVAEPEEFSSALIAETANENPPLGYGIGDMIFDAEIIQIERERVTIKRSSGAIEVLTVGEESGPTRTAAAPAPGGTGDEEDQHIQQISETKFVIDRELVDRYLADVDSLARLGRAIPHRGPDGEIDGYRLSGIRRRSIGEKLGIKNGDVVHGVNGQALTSMQGALGAFSSLQSQSGFQFEVTRRGQKMTLEYEIR